MLPNDPSNSYIVLLALLTLLDYNSDNYLKLNIRFFSRKLSEFG